MTPRARGLTIIGVFAAIVLAVVLAITEASDGAARQAASTTTAPPAPTTAVVAPSTSQPACTATTGRGPDAFTPHCPGPIDVTVTKVTCRGHVGDGYDVTWKVANSGSRLVQGVVTGRADDGQTTNLGTVRLSRGQEAEGGGVVVGSGDAIVVTLASPAGGVIAEAFAEHTPGCPQDPADLRDARQATTSTLRP